jgi:plasmid replication initiation protein
MNTTPIIQEKEIRQSNIITDARYEMTSCELDLFFYLLSQLRPNANDSNRYWLHISDMEALTGRQWNYQQVKEATAVMGSRMYEYYRPNGNLLQIWLFASCEYLKGKGIVEVELSQKMIPHLIELKENFTSYKLLAALNMKSKYAKRIYILCSRWKDKGVKKMTIDELKVMLHLKDPQGIEPEQYRQISELKDRVLEPAKLEINTHSELTIDYQLIKKGRSFQEISFFIDYRQARQSTIEFNTSADIERIRQELNSLGITREDYIERIAHDELMRKKHYKWIYEYKNGKYKNVKAPSGYYLKSLGLID